MSREPPYSSGQDSANDNNANEKYPALDDEIRRTYADTSTATNKNSLYDSYIRAIKWATLRIQDRGVIAYVTNGGFLDSNTADGMRKALASEFSAIHVFNLRGNQRTSGEQSRKEGGKVFDAGSRATVAITVLVKNPDHHGPATVSYTDIGDYLSREDKLARVADEPHVLGLTSQTIVPNQHGDWINQRRDDFGAFYGVDKIFQRLGLGAQSNRDAWVINFDAKTIERSMKTATAAYADALRGSKSNSSSEIKWSSSLEARLARSEVLSFDTEPPRLIAYRPFALQRWYADPRWTHRPGIVNRTFPTDRTSNRGILITAPREASEPAVLICSAAPEGSFFSIGTQVLARYVYEQVGDDGMLDLGNSGDVVDGYRRIDNITDDALTRFKTAYPGEQITKDDIFSYVYGLLHSPEYRETYAADLKKMLPRIPFVADFRAFADAGRKLSELHLGYETVEPYPLDGLDITATGDPYDFFAVGDKKMRFGKPTSEQKAAGERSDRSVIHYNNRITLTGIPLEAYRYMLGSRSAIEWIIDRYYIKSDKASGIVNDPNEWSREVGDPRYILGLLGRIVTVSLGTMKIVDALPSMDIIDGP